MNASRAATYLALVALSLLFLAPVAMMLVGSLKPDERVLIEAGTLAAFSPAGGGRPRTRARISFTRPFR